MEIVKINGSLKDSTGKKANKALRRAGNTPCVMYGGGESISFSCKEPDYRNLIFTPKFKMAEVDLDGQTYQCIVKDIQFHPLTDAVQHIDFLRLVPNTKFKVDLPVTYSGVAPGVKTGGKFMPKVRKVEVITTPEKMVTSINADISEMELGGILRVRDITTVDGLVITNSPAMPIAAIEIPRALRSAQSGGGDAASDDADAEAPAAE